LRRARCNSVVLLRTKSWVNGKFKAYFQELVYKLRKSFLRNLVWIIRSLLSKVLKYTDLQKYVTTAMG
jgi:hypothetical protein